jgi:hypothetical protein
MRESKKENEMISQLFYHHHQSRGEINDYLLHKAKDILFHSFPLESQFYSERTVLSLSAFLLSFS